MKIAHSDLLKGISINYTNLDSKTQALTIDLIAHGLNLVTFFAILTSVQTEGEQRLTVKMRLMTVSRF